MTGATVMRSAVALAQVVTVIVLEGVVKSLYVKAVDAIL